MFYYAPPQSDKQALRAISRRAGCALLVVCALQLAASFVAVFLKDRLGLGGSLWFHLVAVLSGMTVLAGAAVGRRLLRVERRDSASPVKTAQTHGFSSRGTHNFSSRETHCRASLFDACLLIIAGAALCMAGNAVGAFVEQIARQAGIEFQGGPAPAAPQSLPGLLLMLLTVAVLPAVAEEWLLRGVLLPTLKPFGDGFAVACTAALFALLHQNMEQAPMAFVSGLALGWAYVRSGRLVVPVLIHLWNNAAAVAFTLLPEGAANVYVPALAVLGVVGLFVLYLRRRPQDNKGGHAPKEIYREMPAWRRTSNFFFGSAAMALALAYFVVLIGMNTRIT